MSSIGCLLTSWIANALPFQVEEELADVLVQLEDISKGRSEAENIKNQVLREKSSYQMQLEETEEQLAEVSPFSLIVRLTFETSCFTWIPFPILGDEKV